MKIAVLSDSHDNIVNLDKALRGVVEAGCEAIIFCGDFCSPFTADILVAPKIPVYSVWGNNDEDHWAIVSKGKGVLTAATLGQEFHEVVLADRKIAFCHYPRLAELLAGTGYYDAVFHGHTHMSFAKKIGSTILANPGAVCGIVKGKVGPATYMIYDTLKSKVDLITLAS